MLEKDLRDTHTNMYKGISLTQNPVIIFLRGTVEHGHLERKRLNGWCHYFRWFQLRFGSSPTATSAPVTVYSFSDLGEPKMAVEGSSFDLGTDKDQRFI